MMEIRVLTRTKSYPTLSQLEHSGWRSEFPPATRQRICSHIENLFKTNFRAHFFMPVVKFVANDFEGKIFYNLASSESDYLRKIIFKLISIWNSSSSTQSANQINPDMEQGPMPQNSQCNEVPPDFLRYLAMTALHCDGNDFRHGMSKKSTTRTGSYKQVLNWQEETFQEIQSLVNTYGKWFWKAYYWVKDHAEAGGSIIERDIFRGYKIELDSIAQILQVTTKDSVSIELNRNISYYEKRILYYVDMKMSYDSSQIIYSKLENSEPDGVQMQKLNEFIKAFLNEKTKKLGVDIGLIDDRTCDITYTLKMEIVEIVNEWCDHKIRILTRARPTMQETERELSIWQMPGGELQEWCLMKHLEMKVGPTRRHPDPLLEKVRSIWEMHDTELQKQVGPPPQPAVPVPQRVDPAMKEPHATLQKARLVQQFQKQVGPTSPSFDVAQHHWPTPQQMRPALQQSQHCAGSTSQHTGSTSPVKGCGQSKKSL